MSSLADDIIRLRLPLKAKYAGLLRAAVGVFAGSMEFNYDDIVQIRVAVSEVFDMAARCLDRSPQEGPAELEVDLAESRDGLALHFRASSGAFAGPVSDEDEESLAVLTGLMDEVEVLRDGSAVRMVKYRSPRKPMSEPESE